MPLEWLIENPKDSTLLALIPEGEFLAGDEKFPVRLPAYYLALHPVTNAQYRRFKPDWKRNDDHPVVEVNWDDAQAYAKWAGLRLPTELEWEKGARGTDGREYPWGNQWDQSKCRNANNCGNEQTSGVWKYPEGTSPWGLHQMAGNVWEWCEDWYDDKAYTRYKSGNLALPATGVYRVVRGGSWSVGFAADFRCADRSSTGPMAATSATAFGAPGRYDYPLLFCPFTLCLRRCVPQAEKFSWSQMKRYSNLYPAIVDFENLLAAAYRARRGKRYRPGVLAFHFNLEAELLALGHELESKTYQPGGYRAFYIHDPKKRLISAAPYRDRVVHHALCRVIEPIFERGFIHSSYANRVGKGTHAALGRAQHFARRYPYALKCDIEKYFPTIDHAILLERIARKIKCRDTLWLVERIVANSNPQEELVRYFPGDDLFTHLERRRGIPIGNLTSQFFANIYLDGFDHFVQERLGQSAYVRFADDFAIFAGSREELRRLVRPLQDFLDGLRLEMHPTKCHVVPVRCGIPFLGWQLFPDHRRIRRRTGLRFQRRLRELTQGHAAGRIPPQRVRASVMSWIGHLKHGDTWGLRRKLLDGALFGPRPVPMQGE